ncbi:MAG: 2Fe-2S iron-sulfur cluster-binding protein [Chloroflexales bacterium]
MPTVVVNGVSLEGKLGERLIDVARRNGAHVGFVCNGAGICQTCQCQVLSGSASLSPVNVFEQAWLSENRLNEGHRLACKTSIRGEGTIEIRTKAEDLRRQVLAVVNPPADSNPVAQLGPLVQYITRMVGDEVLRFPLNAVNAFRHVNPSDLTAVFRDVNRYLSDVSRVTKTTLNNTPARPHLTTSPQVIQIEAPK